MLQNAGKPDERVVWQGSNGPDAIARQRGLGRRDKARWAGRLLDGYPHAAQLPRRGVFATPDSGRVAAGASYWGIMELSGNLWERVVAVGNPAGRRFAGTHGDWPEVEDGPGGIGLGFRASRRSVNCRGRARTNDNRLRTSDREMLAAVTPVSGGREGLGGCREHQLPLRAHGEDRSDRRTSRRPPEAVQRPLLTDKGMPVLRRAAGGFGK